MKFLDSSDYIHDLDFSVSTPRSRDGNISMKFIENTQMLMQDTFRKKPVAAGNIIEIERKRSSSRDCILHLFSLFYVVFSVCGTVAVAVCMYHAHP